MAQTNLEILDELEDDLLDCVNHASKWDVDKLSEKEIALALFRELRIVKNYNSFIKTGLMGK